MCRDPARVEMDYHVVCFTLSCGNKKKKKEEQVTDA
jgi:hypothetical protein